MALRWLLAGGFGLSAAGMAGCSAGTAGAGLGANPAAEPTGSRTAGIVATSHHRVDGYQNSDGSQINKPLGELLSWQWRRWWEGLPKAPSESIQAYDFPVLTPDLEFLRANRREPTVTFIGHGTVLLQIDGVNILTDPHFAERAFMVQWAGPKRKVRLPMTMAQLPHIDIVVISHNHYDHLDHTSVLALNAQPGGPPWFGVPLGLDQWFRDQGIDRVTAMDWWQTSRVGPIDVSLVPSHHWSSRTPFDRNQTLWGGWVFRGAAADSASQGFTVYYAGDTGYSADFKEIGRRFGGFDLALIPVGAYEPRDFMRDQHVDPDESVKIHQDVRARLSIGVHWGTFELTDEPLDAPIRALPKAVAAAGVAPTSFVLLRHGETRRLTR